MRVVKLKGMRQVNGLHYAPDGRRLLAVGGYEVRSVDEARWVDVVGGTETLRVPLNASCYAVSSDLKRIAVGEAQPHEDDTELPAVVVIDPTDSEWFEDEYGWQEIIRTHPTAVEVYALAFAPNGKRLAVSYTVANSRGSHTDFRLAVRPLGRGKPVEVVSGQDEGEFAATVIRFTPNGRFIATNGGIEGSQVFTERYAGTLAHRRTSVASPAIEARQLVYSPDSGTLAVARGRAVSLIPPATSKVPLRLLPHPKQVNAVAFTPDGRRILTTCTDKLVRVWDATSGQLVVSYDWNVGVTNAIAVAPDGLTAAVSGQSGNVVLFDLEG